VERPSGQNNILRESIYRNPAGVPEWRATVIVIESESDPAKPPPSFLDQIRPLDIIQIIPRAQSSDCANFIQSAEMEIMCTKPLAAPKTLEWLRPCYAKTGLESHCIRLLVLLPGSITDMIRVQLTRAVYDDPDCPAYEALSYCWGEWKEDEIKKIQQVTEDGSTLPVHALPSLWGALVHLRNTESKRILWIDQLCINQADKNELANQVSIMGQIYAGA
jgi:hypothetical protein